jgi:hypothetical protein
MTMADLGRIKRDRWVFFAFGLNAGVLLIAVGAAFLYLWGRTNL